MKNLKLTLLALTAVFALTFYACKKEATEPTVTSDAKPTPAGKTYYSIPTLSCAGSTKESIALTVTAGSTGAPAGFSIQWMTAAAYAANNNAWPTDETQFCKASFSGKAFQSNYNLAANASVTVIVGDFLFDNGASTSVGCDGDLACGTQYVFRAFAHGDNVKDKSDWDYENCSTAACEDCGGKRHGFGYWKNHTSEWPGNPFDLLADPNAPYMSLGTTPTWYTATQILSIMNQSPSTNGLVILAHQLITTKLNVANGSVLNGTGITAADAQIGTRVIPPVGSGTYKPNENAGLIPALHNYNHTCTETVN